MSGPARAPRSASASRRALWLALLCVALFAPAVPAAEDDTLEIVVAGRAQRFDRAALAARLPVHTVTIDDPDYDAPVTFDGFALRDVLALAGADGAHGDELVFGARDGYAPTVAYAAVQAHDAFVAFREHDNPDGFRPVRQGKALVSPAPYFLVWREGAALGPDFPWPYQLVRMEVIDFATRYAALYPADLAADTPARRGFDTFKLHCLRCHAINLQGGDLGPELNVPRNVTEYWTPNHLRGFIHDATAYHARSKMPSFRGVLDDARLDDLLAYLSLMASRKVSVPAEPGP